MTLTLIGSLTSPYVRKLRLFLQNEKDYEFKSINYFEQNDSEYLKSINPINKIPVLLDNGKPIYESRVIFNHVAKKNKLAPLSIEEENYLSAIDSALESGVNLFLLKKSGLDISDTSNWYVGRQRERFVAIFHYLSSWAKKMTPEKDWNYLSMSLYSMLYWGSFREVYQYTDYPELLNFMERFKNCPGIAETDIPRP